MPKSKNVTKGSGTVHEVATPPRKRRKRGRKAKFDAKDRRIAELEKKLCAADKERLIMQGLLDLQKSLGAARCDSPHVGEVVMDALEDLPAAIPVSRACAAAGMSRATLYRKTSLPAPPKPRLAKPVRALSTSERDELVALMHSPEYVDQPPREIYGTLLSLGIYLASVSTMYRILAALSESNERRPGHVRTLNAIPRLEAFAPNQIWTWDITKVRGAVAGTFYFVHVIIDLFSRYVVGWMVAETENAKLATHLISEALANHGVAAGTLTVHSDRGSPMKAGSMTQLLATLGRWDAGALLVSVSSRDVRRSTDEPRPPYSRDRHHRSV